MDRKYSSCYQTYSRCDAQKLFQVLSYSADCEVSRQRQHVSEYASNGAGILVLPFAFHSCLTNVCFFLKTTLGRDVSAMFYKTNVWKNYCNLPQPNGWDNIMREVPRNAFRVW
jgi:hypothetical protein